MLWEPAVGKRQESPLWVPLHGARLGGVASCGEYLPVAYIDSLSIDAKPMRRC
jgi:hypothetical protein